MNLNLTLRPPPHMHSHSRPTQNRPRRSARLSRALLLGCGLLLIATGNRSQAAPGPGALDWDLLAPWLAAQTNLQTWSADFVQTRQLAALAQPLVSTGQVWFAAPNRFRWELGRPPQTLAIRQAGEMVILYPRLKRAERYPLSQTRPGPWRDALSLFEAGFPRGAAELTAQFNVLDIGQTNGLRHVELEPKAPGARRLMPRIRIEFDAGTGALLATQLRFADGSTLRNEFKNALRNPPLADRLFETTISPDYKITEPWR